MMGWGCFTIYCNICLGLWGTHFGASNSVTLSLSLFCSGKTVNGYAGTLDGVAKFVYSGGHAFVSLLNTPQEEKRA